MSKPDETKWELFGFPNPGFMPAHLPAEGLTKALAERGLPFSEKWDFDAIAKNDLISRFGTMPSGQSWCRDFDSRLESLAGRYLNHLKLSDQSDWSDLSDVMWTWHELLLKAADDDETRIADPGKGDLSPEWNLTWLLQRRKAIDLLLYAPVQYRFDVLSGSTHTGIPSSPSESVAAALAGLVPAEGGGLPGTSVHNIYGPDHGWREGSYCCDVQAVCKIYADLPAGFVSDGNVYLVLKVTGADSTDGSFAGAEGKLHVGVNILTADQEGVFVEFGNRDLASLAGSPAKDRTTSGGWRSTVCQAFADYSPKFHFRCDE